MIEKKHSTLPAKISLEAISPILLKKIPEQVFFPWSANLNKAKITVSFFFSEGLFCFF